MKRFIIGNILKIVIGVPLLILAIGFVTMSLWNWLIPALFHGPVITFFQALGILVLSKILFSGFKGGGRCGCHKGGHSMWRDHMKEKWNNLSTEERDKLKSRFFNKCGPKFGSKDSDTTNA